MTKSLNYKVLAKAVFIAILLLFAAKVNAQVGVGTTTPEASAMLEIKSDSSGLLIPRLTSSQRDNISSPAEGLAIYCTNCDPETYYIYVNSAWKALLTDEIDGSTTNEIQTISRSGTTVTLSNSGGSFTDSVLTESQVDDFASNNGYLTSEVDGSITNEIQDLSLANNTLSLSSDATTVDLSSYLDADNLGDHTATANIQLNGNWLSNDGGSEGVFVNTDGNVGIGTTSPHGTFDVLTGGINHDMNILFENAGSDQQRITFQEDNLDFFTIYHNGTGAGWQNKLTFQSANSNDGNIDVDIMTLGQLGYVGIGTTDPGFTLEVEENDYSSIGTPYSNSIASFSDGSGNGYISINSPDASERGILFGEPSSSTAGGIIYNNSSTVDGFQFRVNGNDTKMVLNSSGYVGIGTTDPQVPLTVFGGQSEDARFGRSNGEHISIHVDDNHAYIDLEQDADDNGTHTMFFRNNASGTGENNIRFVTSGSTAMTVADNGNIGIGTIDPDGPLHVEETSGSGNFYFDAEHYSTLLLRANTDNDGSNADASIQYSFGGSFLGEMGFNNKSNGRFLKMYAGGSAGFSGGANGISINQSGNVGIGVEDAEQPLSLNGPVLFQTSSSTFQNVPYSPNNTDQALLTAVSSGSTTDWRFYIEDDYQDKFSIWGNSCGGGDCNNLNNSQVLATITGQGRLGIQTSNPEAQLHIRRDDGDSWVIIESDTGNGDENDNPSVVLKQDGGATQGIFALNSENNSHFFDALGNATYLEAANGTPLQFVTGGTGFTNYDGAARMTITGTGNVGIGLNNPSVSLDIAGSIEYTGTITDVSDRRLKENFEEIESPLEKIQQIQGYSYNMINDSLKVREFGVIAQEVQKVFPEMISVIDPENGYLGMSYIQLVPVLLESIKEQQEIIDSLKADNTQLNSKLDTLESKQDELLSLIQKLDIKLNQLNSNQATNSQVLQSN